MGDTDIIKARSERACFYVEGKGLLTGRELWLRIQYTAEDGFQALDENTGEEYYILFDSVDLNTGKFYELTEIA